MKELMSYYNSYNLMRGGVISLIAVVILILLGASSGWGLALFFVLGTLGTPALIARNDAINKWEEENFIDRM